MLRADPDERMPLSFALQVQNYFHVADHLRGIWMAGISNNLLAFTYCKVQHLACARGAPRTRAPAQAAPPLFTHTERVCGQTQP